MNTLLINTRLHRGLTKAAVAKELNIHKSTYGNIEAGKSLPSPRVAERIAEFFKHEITETQLLYPERYCSTAITQEHPERIRGGEADYLDTLKQQTLPPKREGGQ